MGIFGLLFIILPLIIFFILLGMGVTLVRSILRFFGFGRTASRDYDYGRSQEASHSRQGNNGSSSSTQSSPKNKKVIGDDEGEYVEFEEVR